MLRFRVFRDGKVPDNIDLSTACLVGADGVPIRGEFFYEEGEIFCRKRAAGPAALAIMWETAALGSVILETTRLPERDEPYNLNLELARGRMMRFFQKREEWGLLEIAEAASVNEKANEARDSLIEALIHADNPAAASVHADVCLAMILPLSEQAALTHADLLLQRRVQTRNFPRSAFGCMIDPTNVTEPYRRLLVSNFDFVQLPMRWRMIEPQEEKFDWSITDEWIDFLRRVRMPLVAGPLVRFDEINTPDWLYIWEHDYETVRDFLYEYIDRVVQRYAPHVTYFNVLSGLHVNQEFSFTFDQLMDVTRMSVGLVKKFNANARTMIELTQPWGEYYAGNQRSIPPLLYAEMIVQSGITFDMFGLQLRFGMPKEGCWQRDLFQISALLDRFSSLGKPVMLTGLQVPSAPNDPAAGTWRKPWSEQMQSKWLESVTDIALSKPFVEAISWQDLCDVKDAPIPNGGLVNVDVTPKAAMKTWANLRRAVISFRNTAQQKPAGKKEAPTTTP
jgi:hypothetical protein